MAPNSSRGKDAPWSASEGNANQVVSPLNLRSRFYSIFATSQTVANTLNKALRIMGHDTGPRRRPLRARLPLDRVDLAQRGGRVRQRCDGSPTRPRRGERELAMRRGGAAPACQGRQEQDPRYLQSGSLLERTRALDAALGQSSRPPAQGSCCAAAQIGLKHSP